jgi:hypothetical protein
VYPKVENDIIYHFTFIEVCGCLVHKREYRKVWLTAARLSNQRCALQRFLSGMVYVFGKCSIIT